MFDESLVSEVNGSEETLDHNNCKDRNDDNGSPIAWWLISRLSSKFTEWKKVVHIFSMMNFSLAFVYRMQMI